MGDQHLGSNIIQGRAEEIHELMFQTDVKGMSEQSELLAVSFETRYGSSM